MIQQSAQNIFKAVDSLLSNEDKNFINILNSFNIGLIEVAADALDGVIDMAYKDGYDGSQVNLNTLSNEIAKHLKHQAFVLLHHYDKMVFNNPMPYVFKTWPDSPINNMMLDISQKLYDNRHLPFTDFCFLMHKKLVEKYQFISKHEKLSKIHPHIIVDFDDTKLPDFKPIQAEAEFSLEKGILELLPIPAYVAEKLSCNPSQKTLEIWFSHWESLTDDDKDAIDDEHVIHIQDLNWTIIKIIRAQLKIYLENNFGANDTIIDIVSSFETDGMAISLNFELFQNWDDFIEKYQKAIQSK